MTRIRVDRRKNISKQPSYIGEIHAQQVHQHLQEQKEQGYHYHKARHIAQDTGLKSKQVANALCKLRDRGPEETGLHITHGFVGDKRSSLWEVR